MFEELDDNNEVYVPDDAVARAKVAGAARLRRRYALLGGVAVGLLVAASIPLLTGEKGKTDVTSADEPATQSTDTIGTTGVATSTSQAPASATTSTPADTAPLFARIDAGSLVVSHYDGTARRVIKAPTRSAEITAFKWSPRRTRLLIAADVSSTPPELDLFDVATGRVSPIAKQATWAEPPWSPDDSKVLYNVQPTDNSSEPARVYDVKAQASRKIANVGAWSPDSRRVGFVEGVGDENALTLVPVAGGGSVVVARGVGVWAWAPDSRSIAYAEFSPTMRGVPEEPDKDKPIHVVRVDGSGDVSYAHALAGAKTVAVDLAWSPDGRSLLADRRIFVGNPTTTCPCELGGTPSAGTVTMPAGTWHDFPGKSFSWNDKSYGRVLPSFPTFVDSDPWTTDSTGVFLQGDQNALYLMADDGSSGRMLTNAPGYWFPSPDRAFVVVGATHDSSPPVLVTVATGASKAVATAFMNEDQWVGWSDDGAVFVLRDETTRDFVVIGRDGAIKWRFHD